MDNAFIPEITLKVPRMSNAEQIDYWNGAAGQTWARMQERMDAALTPVTAALLSLAAPQLGEDVLDIGCGSGETTLALAGAVGDEGSALGLDISEPLLDRARARAEELLSEADFRNADAAVFDAESGFDLLVSRFGVMFFADPAAAFGNLHDRMAPGGRLSFACWQPASENLWATLPMTVLADLLPPSPPSDPLAPGPFAFADPERVHNILAAAGWQDIVFHALPFTMVIGDGEDPVASAVHFNLRIGPAARVIREAGPEVEPVARATLAAALTGHVSDGVVGLPAAVWLVSARA
jgi:SAM-dependent methyltransferase